MYADAAEEDEVSFIEASSNRERVLRGTLIGEDAEFFYLQRRDGDWQIKRSTVTRVKRSAANEAARKKSLALRRRMMLEAFAAQGFDPTDPRVIAVVNKALAKEGGA
jgi:hypothetical protein